MPGPRYSLEEIGLLLDEFNQGTPLSGIECKLNRPSGGIASKILSLSEEDPDTWSPEIAKEYKRLWEAQYRDQNRDKKRKQGRVWYGRWYSDNKYEERKRKRQWHKKWYSEHSYEVKKRRRERYLEGKIEELFPYVQNISDVGYNIGLVELTSNKLRITIEEPKSDIDRDYLMADFNETIQKQDFPYSIPLNFSFQENNLIISPNPSYERGRISATAFLQAYKRVLEQKVK